MKKKDTETVQRFLFHARQWFINRQVSLGKRMHTFRGTFLKGGEIQFQFRNFENGGGDLD